MRQASLMRDRISYFRKLGLGRHFGRAVPVRSRVAFSLFICLALLSCLPRRTPVSSQPAPITASPNAAPVIPSTPAGDAARLIGTYVPPKDAPQQCQDMSNYGARFTWMSIPWDAIEPVKGTFSWKRADAIVLAVQKCGFDIGFHILSRHAGGWATLPTPNIPNKANASMPPKDMNEYYNFVFQLASHYKGVVSRYSIENEAHSSSNWPSSPESYFQMLAVAYRAIKAADPNAFVEDAALSSSGLGVLVANDMLKAGNTQGAVDFLHRYFATFAPRQGGGEPIVVAKAEDLQNLIAQPEVQRLLQWAPLLFANHDYYDIEQLHYFGPWDDLPVVMDWVHSQLKAQGADKPLDLWEMGYAWTDVNTFDPQAQARDLPKFLATSMGEGAERTVSWLFTDIAFTAEGHPGLISNQGPRPAAQSFEVTCEKLNGTTSSTRLNLGPDVWGYRFDKSSGSVYAVWSTQPRQISLPITAPQVTVTTITNQTMTADPQKLDVSDSPIFVEVK